MTERPVLFTGPMVRAILEGRKTQTRRVIRPQPEWNALGFPGSWSYYVGRGVYRSGVPERSRCPYGVPRDVLWVREKILLWRSIVDGRLVAEPETESPVYQDDPDWEQLKREGKMLHENERIGWEVVPSIHMPRWACRLLLTVTDVRVERVQDISEEDAEREGIEEWEGMFRCGPDEAPCWTRDERYAFAWLWDSINAKRGYSWESNPWVWVVSFEREADR